MSLELEDIVIDTNVLKNAQDHDNKCYKSSFELLENILQSNTNICIDKGFNVIAIQNRSRIGAEYLKHIRPGTYSYLFLMTLVTNHRIKHLEKYPSGRRKQIIFEKISGKKTKDRILLGVACNSNENVLASNEFEDFPRPKRTELKRRIRVKIHCAEEICEQKSNCHSIC